MGSSPNGSTTIRVNIEEMIKIGLDVDNVLADFDRGFAKWFKAEYVPRETYRSELITKNYGKIARFPNFWKSLKPLFDPSLIEFEIDCYITARSIPSDVTHAWLLKRGFPDAPVISTGVGKKVSKVVPVNERKLDFFVDDRFSTYEELNADSNATCILMSQSYNLKDDAEFRVNNIQELNEFFNNLK